MIANDRWTFAFGVVQGLLERFDEVLPECSIKSPSRMLQSRCQYRNRPFSDGDRSAWSAFA